MLNVTFFWPMKWTYLALAIQSFDVLRVVLQNLVARKFAAGKVLHLEIREGPKHGIMRVLGVKASFSYKLRLFATKRARASACSAKFRPSC